MLKMITWIFAGIGASISMVASVGIAASQSPVSGASIFPLPGLILIDWFSTGILGLIFSIAAFNPPYARLGRGVWIMTGALLPLIVLGALSIGPLVLASAACFLVAAITVTLHTRDRFVEMLGYGFLGAIGNLIISLGLILINSLLHP